MRPCWFAIVILLSLDVAAASAQHRQAGAKVGATAASPHYETKAEDPGYGNRVYVSGGGFLIQPIGGPVAFQLEGLFMPKGGEVAGKDAADTTITLILNYFEIPALARATLQRSPSHAIYVFAGPSAGVRTSAKFRVAAGRPVRSGITNDISADIKRFELSMIVGGGVDVGRHGVIDARYSWGLTNVNRDAPDAHAVRNRAFTVLVGFRY